MKNDERAFLVWLALAGALGKFDLSTFDFQMNEKRRFYLTEKWDRKGWATGEDGLARLNIAGARAAIDLCPIPVVKAFLLRQFERRENKPEEPEDWMIEWPGYEAWRHRNNSMMPTVDFMAGAPKNPAWKFPSERERERCEACAKARR